MREQDIKIENACGPQGGYVRVVHVPTGCAVVAAKPLAGSFEEVKVRLLEQLRDKLRAEGLDS